MATNDVLRKHKLELESLLNDANANLDEAKKKLAEKGAAREKIFQTLTDLKMSMAENFQHFSDVSKKVRAMSRCAGGSKSLEEFDEMINPLLQYRNYLATKPEIEKDYEAAKAEEDTARIERDDAAELQFSVNVLVCSAQLAEK